jgi:hypothetical protein
MQFENRKQSFKNRGALKADEIRRRREDLTVEIRKQKKNESLAKRRNLVAAASESDDDLAPATFTVYFVNTGPVSRSVPCSHPRSHVSGH